MPERLSRRPHREAWWGFLDIPDPTQTTAPYGTKRVFAVGISCTIVVAIADAGPLYLSMNDEPLGFQHHSGELHVELAVAPL